MMKSFPLNRPRIVYWSICALAALFASFMVLASAYGQQPDSQDSPSVAIGKSQWYIRWGDSPLDDQGAPIWTYDNISSPGWQPIAGESHLLSDTQGQRFQWLMIQVPDGHWKHPGLLLPTVSENMEVYQNHQLVYRSGKFEPSYSNRHDLEGYFSLASDSGHTNPVALEKAF